MKSESATKVGIRPMELKDIGAVFEINKRLTVEEQVVTLTSLVAQDLGGDLDLSFVAEVNNRVVGFILGRYSAIGEPIIDAGLIQEFGVDPLYQGYGIGEQLFNAFTNKARSKGIKTLRVILRKRDSRLKDFLSHKAFHRAQLIVYDKTL